MSSNDVKIVFESQALVTLASITDNAKAGALAANPSTTRRSSLPSLHQNQLEAEWRWRTSNRSPL
jgi:hypothetical protein